MGSDGAGVRPTDRADSPPLMNYGELIKQAFSIARHHRYLWFFGIFAGSSAGGNFNVPGGGFPSYGGNGDDFSSQASSSDFMTFLIVVGVVVAVLVLVSIALSLISQGALATSVAAIDGGERRSFGLAWRAGLATFWRVLGEALLFGVIAIGCLLAIGIPVGLVIFAALAGGDPSGGGIALIVLVALLAVVALIVVFFPLTIIWQLALRALIVGEEGVVDALRTGWRMFRTRLGTSLLLGLLQLALGIAGAIVLFLAALLVGLALFIPAIALGISGYYTAAIVAAVVAGLVLLGPFLAAIGALGTFNHAFWTLAYLRLTAPPASAAGGPMHPPPPGPAGSPPPMGGRPPGPMPPPAAA